jgi:PAS domain S-box-containing protein
MMMSDSEASAPRLEPHGAGGVGTDPSRQQAPDRDALVSALLELARSLSASRDVDRRLADLCRTTVELLGCDRSSVFLLENGCYRARCNHGNPPDIAALFPDHKVSIRDPLIARAMETQGFVVVNEASRSPLMDGATAQRARIHSIVVAPIVDGARQPLGFLTAEFNERIGVFTETMSRLVLGMATLAGLAITGGRHEIERQRAAAAVAASEAHFRALVEHAFDGIGIWDAHGTIVQVTAAAPRMFGAGSQARLGRSFLDFVHPDDVARCRRWWTSVLEAPARAHDVEARVRHEDGTWLWLEATARNALGDPNVSGVVVNFRDVTARKHAEDEVRALNEALEERVRERTAQLESANRELETFSYSVSHDLRAPLRAIVGFSSLLLADHGGSLDPRARQYLQSVRANADRMHHLIEDLLNLARVTREAMHLAPVDLGALGRAIVDDLCRREPERHIEVVIAPRLVARGDARLLRVALENLLGNAWKYTSKHPTARIELGRLESAAAGDDAGGTTFFVRDDGAGFRMEHAGRLFEPFRRMHAASEFDGTGVGLATTRRIIERHGGRVWAEAAVEQGATFFFTLPN